MSEIYSPALTKQKRKIEYSGKKVRQEDKQLICFYYLENKIIKYNKEERKLLSLLWAYPMKRSYVKCILAMVNIAAIVHTATPVDLNPFVIVRAMLCL